MIAGCQGTNDGIDFGGFTHDFGLPNRSATAVPVSGQMSDPYSDDLSVMLDNLGCAGDPFMLPGDDVLFQDMGNSYTNAGGGPIGRSFSEPPISNLQMGPGTSALRSSIEYPNLDPWAAIQQSQFIPFPSSVCFFQPEFVLRFVLECSLIKKVFCVVCFFICVCLCCHKLQ